MYPNWVRVPSINTSPYFPRLWMPPHTKTLDSLLPKCCATKSSAIRYPGHLHTRILLSRMLRVNRDSPTDTAWRQWPSCQSRCTSSHRLAMSPCWDQTSAWVVFFLPGCKESTSDRPDATTPSDGVHSDEPQHRSWQKSVGSAHAGQDTILSCGGDPGSSTSSSPTKLPSLPVPLIVACGTPSCHLGPLLLTWFNFNPSMDK